MEIFDNRTKAEQERDKQAIFQNTALWGCIIAVIYMLVDMCG